MKEKRCASGNNTFVSCFQLIFKVGVFPFERFSDRMMPNPEGQLDNVLRAASGLYPAGLPFEGLNALIVPPKRDI